MAEVTFVHVLDVQKHVGCNVQIISAIIAQIIEKEWNKV